MTGDLRGLAALVLLAGALRFAAVEVVFPLPLIGDERHYVDTATHLALGLGHRSNLRDADAATPPLHPFLLSLAVDVERPPVDPSDPEPRRHAERYVDAQRVRGLLRLQAAVGTGLVVLTALLAGVLFGRRAAYLAGGTAAVYPAFLAYSHYLWSTLLFAALLTAALTLFWRARQSGGLLASVAAGGLFGLAALTRETALPVAAACGALQVFGSASGQRAASAKRALVLLAVALVTVAPWTLRNGQRLGRWVPVSEIGWMALAEGNVLSASGERGDPERLQHFRRAYFGIADAAERARFARSEALAGIAAAQPGWLPRKLVENTTRLFRPDSFLHKKLDRGAYGEIPTALSRALLVGSVGSYVGVCSFALIGFAAASPPVAALGAAVVATVSAVHVVANASSRYRLPLMPLLIAFAAHGFLAWRSGRLELRTARGAACMALLALFWLGSVLGFASDFASLWSVGRYAGGPS